MSGPSAKPEENPARSESSEAPFIIKEPPRIFLKKGKDPDLRSGTSFRICGRTGQPDTCQNNEPSEKKFVDIAPPQATGKPCWRSISAPACEQHNARTANPAKPRDSILGSFYHRIDVWQSWPVIKIKESFETRPGHLVEFGLSSCLHVGVQCYC